ncbi:MAG: DUF2924 domain-containing protein [Nitrospiraceae bacterium]|nr:DUF2924 domain-containing protein [Nitrospiraceae bacterium]
MTDQEHAKLREILRQQASRMHEYRNQRIREENTKQTLINPVLEALGWNTSDWTEVDYEFRPESADNPVDYALKIDRVPKLLIEAKALGSDLSNRKSVAQILKYAFMADVTWCVLTDGDEYRIYNAMAAVKPGEKLMCRVRISDDNEECTASRLALLSRSNLEGNQLESFWAVHFVDRQVKAALQKMLNEVDKSLVGLIRKATTLKPKEIVESLRRLGIVIDSPPQPVRLAALNGVTPAPTGEGTKVRKKRGGSEATLAEIIGCGLLSAPCQLFREYKGQTFEATVLADGTVEFQGTKYATCSAAGNAARAVVTGRKMSTNGWTFWRFRDADGKVRELGTVRERYAAGASAQNKAD